ncbi:MAG: helix-turn-helix domain-containing protein [Planctomycetes bacterium]|jgi:transcriptional regulator with XRE-family HTH domain|nr:helix-turn-helix domain-containing protein [Planctomycetota bacterium]MBT4027910.1 helix-turn-helix domain-containing protein [Planctomycetota bacterium]MBT4560025.1 helix-turn-helix domain-containing protein [Planctomycetota bacterium]MBT5100465.1 helix-turn-helix domain-containing protein [Planctomycetota bacterium]MBT5119680.1 helix-turn-helix domain-containing protein [Planctomycetota bacterium]
MTHKRPFTDSLASTEAVLVDLGQKLQAERLRRNLTQSKLAHEAGISLSTLKRAEAGKTTQLDNLICILRVLGLLSRIQALIPDALPSPMLELKMGQARRKRASSASLVAEKPRADWEWGDDS